MAVIVSATPEHFGFTSGHYDDLTKMANDIEKEANKKDATFISVMSEAIRICREFKDRISCSMSVSSNETADFMKGEIVLSGGKNNKEKIYTFVVAEFIN